MDDKRQATALFRYSLIRELADPELGPRQRGARIRALAATDHAFDGQRVEVTGPTLRSTIDADLGEGVEDTAEVLVALSLPSLRSADAATRLLEGPRGAHGWRRRCSWSTRRGRSRTCWTTW